MKIAWSDLRTQYLFGMMDGLNGAVGMVIGMVSSAAATRDILVALMSRAFSSCVSMAGSQYASDEVLAGRKWRAGAMGFGYLTSAALPGLGFGHSIRVGLAVFIPATGVILATIIWVRHLEGGWRRATVVTLTIFCLAVLAGYLASLIG